MILKNLNKNFLINIFLISLIFSLDRISKIYVINLNQKLKSLTENTDFSELCITSSAEVSYKDDIETTAITSKANGSKCSICWKIKESACSRVNCAVNIA